MKDTKFSSIRYWERALYTHCYYHTLNLAIADTIKQSKDTLEVFTKKKCYFWLNSVRRWRWHSVGITHFIQLSRLYKVTQLRVSYNLNKLWEEWKLRCQRKGNWCANTNSKFNVLFYVCTFWRSPTKTLQKGSLSAAEAQNFTKLTVRSNFKEDKDLELFFKLVLSLQNHFRVCHVLWSRRFINQGS